LITPADDDYQATKKIKQGHEVLEEQFAELADWINERWSVTVLNVIYAPRNKLHAPRVSVILEHHGDAGSFRDGINFDKKKQNEVAARFIEIANQQADHGYDFEGLFVIFSPFSPVAHQEAKSKISDQDVEALKRRIGNSEIWEVKRLAGQLVFMFFTDAQVKENTENGTKAAYTDMYLNMLKPHDEFDYLTKDNCTVRFDSKQNFDDKYRGDWNYYWKCHY